MKTVQFTNIHLEHFGKHENIQSKLGHRTIIEGANATGKSTIKRAIQYILGTKDENGKEISGIRPHDENGIDIDGLTTVAELTVSVDGAENTLKRTCFQEMNRQKQYTGKDNLQYYVDDVKKGTRKAYDEYVSTIIPATVCISAQELLMKDTAGRRKLLEPFLKHTNDDVIDENPQFEELRAGLRANSVDELKKAYRDKIKDRTKKRDEVIVEIRTRESDKVEIDLAELELLKNALNEKIEENKEKQADISKQFEEYDRKTDGIIELKCELSDLERKANEENIKQRKELQSQIDDKEEEVTKLTKTISANVGFIANYEKEIEDGEKEKERLLEKWNKVNAEEFDESTTICPTCHRELPQEERERLLTEFETSKTERLNKINKDGLKVKKDIEGSSGMIEQLKTLNEEYGKRKDKLKAELERLEQQLSALTKSIDISDREDVKQLKQQIAEKEQAMQKGNSASEIRQQLQDEREELQRQKAEVQKQFEKAEENNRIDERVAELKKQQLALSQEIADIERELDLLKQFERKKAELLESDVNENFDLVQFRMFEKMVGSDDLKDVCHILVDGESYDRNLNFSNRLLAEVDICRGFQRKYDVELPVLLDNAESINDFRLPDIENQLILFRCSDETELTIKCLE